MEWTARGFATMAEAWLERRDNTRLREIREEATHHSAEDGAEFSHPAQDQNSRQVPNVPAESESPARVRESRPCPDVPAGSESPARVRESRPCPDVPAGSGSPARVRNDRAGADFPSEPRQSARVHNDSPRERSQATTVNTVDAAAADTSKSSDAGLMRTEEHIYNHDGYSYYA